MRTALIRYGKLGKGERKYDICYRIDWNNTNEISQALSDTIRCVYI